MAKAARSNVVPIITGRGAAAPKVGVRTITPDTAARMLKKNTVNRNMRERVVASYARDMEAGRWTEDGAPIRVADDGTLLDGQHRLAAIVRSGVSMKMVVVTGVDQAAILNIDNGARRTFSDTLKLMGYMNTTQIAACCRWGVAYEAGLMRAKAGITHSEMLEWLNDHDEISNIVRRHRSNGIQKKLPGVETAIEMIELYAAPNLPEDFAAFMHGVLTGVELSEHSPMLHLRRFVMNAQLTDHRPPPIAFHAVTIKAWNAFVRGDGVSVLKFRSGGAVPEEFPTIITEA